MDVSLILPTRNEAANIGEAIRCASVALSDYDFEIVVVDDDSPDGTAGIARKIAETNPRIRVIQRIGRRGLASACMEGALASSGKVIAVMDADLQHDEALLPELVRAVLTGNTDLAVGSRYAGQGGTGDWQRDRVAKSRLATRLTSLFLKTPLTDPMSGFFAVRAEVFQAAIPKMSGRGFKVLLDLLFSASSPLKVCELPFEFRARSGGESKLDLPVALQFLMMLYERWMGHVIPVRFVLFALVGGSGLLIHLLVLFLVFRMAGQTFLVGQTSAVITAMTYNYVVNNALTFRDIRLKGWAFVRGWLSFMVVCGIGAIANVGVAAFLFDQGHVIWTLSALAGVMIGAVWNYAMSSRFTWGRL